MVIYVCVSHIKRFVLVGMCVILDTVDMCVLKIIISYERIDIEFVRLHATFVGHWCLRLKQESF